MNPEKAKTVKYQPRNSKLSLQTWKKRLTQDEIVRIKKSTYEVASQLYAGDDQEPWARFQ